MSSPDSVALASALVNISVIGFITFFGTATIVPMVHGLSQTVKNEKNNLYKMGFSYRLVKKIKEDKSVFLLTFVSLLFIITGLFSLLYFVFDYSNFLTASLHLSVVSMVGLIICISWIVVPAIIFAFIKKDNVAKIYEFIVAAYDK